MPSKPPLPVPVVPSSSPDPAAHVLSSEHRATRLLYRLLPLPVQHWLRDHGFLRLFDYPAVMTGFLFLLPTRPDLLQQILLPPAGVHRGVRYGPLARHHLDVYATHRHGASDASPVLLFTHGGAWGSGNRWMYGLLGTFFDQCCGCVAVVHDYHVWPDADAGAQCGDVRAALSWTRAHCADYGGDPQRIFLAGHSSGAHIASLLLLTKPPSADAPPSLPFSPFAASAAPSSPVAGFIGLSGVYSIAAHYEFERRRGVHELSPMKPANGHHVGFLEHSPAVWKDGEGALQQQPGGWRTRWLLVHGDRDGTVPDEQSRRAAETRGGRVLYTATTVDGRHIGAVAMAEGEAVLEEGEEVSVGRDDDCSCVVYREADHGSTVLSLMAQNGHHLIRTLQTFIGNVSEAVAAFQAAEHTACRQAQCTGVRLPAKL